MGDLNVEQIARLSPKTVGTVATAKENVPAIPEASVFIIIITYDAIKVTLHSKLLQGTVQSSSSTTYIHWMQTWQSGVN